MLEAENIGLSFGRRCVFSNLSLRLNSGDVYGISGQSGCGKTTLGRVLAGLQRPDSGQVQLDQHAPAMQSPWPVQYLYQSPVMAMNPRWRIGKILREPGPVDGDMAHALGVQREWADRYPHELSGGQLQRISILRALGARPRYLIADEITAALDPVAQAQIWRALLGLTQTLELGIVAISHDEGLLGRLGCDNRRLRLGHKPDDGLTRTEDGWL
jgi:peptide/nickel transport system ATP-binding protein